MLDWEEPGVEQWRERRSYRAAKVFLLMAFLAQWKGRKSWRGRRRQKGHGSLLLPVFPLVVVDL